jgi:Leucine-rich repeat (LRR) protein
MPRFQWRLSQEARQRIDAARSTGAPTLDLGSNRLTALPPEVGRLTNLQTLDLRFNRLTTLPRRSPVSPTSRSWASGATG